MFRATTNIDDGVFVQKKNAPSLMFHMNSKLTSKGGAKPLRGTV